jgi:hypothetical protein
LVMVASADARSLKPLLGRAQLLDHMENQFGNFSHCCCASDASI